MRFFCRNFNLFLLYRVKIPLRSHTDFFTINITNFGTYNFFYLLRGKNQNSLKSANWERLSMSNYLLETEKKMFIERSSIFCACVCFLIKISKCKRKNNFRNCADNWSYGQLFFKTFFGYWTKVSKRPLFIENRSPRSAISFLSSEPEKEWSMNIWFM